MKPCIFTGSAVAIVTPFRAGSIDFNAFDRLVERQILNYDERMALIERCVRIVDRRVPVIAGSGTNNTASSVALSKATQSAGVDALLTVTPYYNKASQSGLVQHFSAIADAVDIPVILYNVPSRTGCNLLPETCAALAGHPRIAAVKEASGNLSQIVSLFHKAEAHLDVYSGNDDQIVPILAMGGEGCISVLSNVLPKEAVRLCELFFSGDVRGAAALQCRLLPVIDALFSEVNPIPVKAALAKMGYGTDTLRLPLTPMEEGRRAVLLNALEAWGV